MLDNENKIQFNFNVYFVQFIHTGKNEQQKLTNNEEKLTLLDF